MSTSARLQREKGQYGMVGLSAPMQRVYRLLDQIADKQVTVLVSGESGTGKELVAGALHRYGSCSSGPYVAFSCADIPESILESQLFGFKRGAFTGAVQDNPGLIRAAENGTLFMDEVGEMGKGVQAKLLRFLEEREVRPLGGKQASYISTRVVAATNKNLEEEVKKKAFREDLYYRLAVVTINLVPLRSRKEDIPLLADHFVDIERQNHNMGPCVLDPECYGVLQSYHWPGNIRQLRNLITRAVIISPDYIIPASLLEKEIAQFTPVHKSEPAAYGEEYQGTMAEIEKRVIMQRLLEKRNNKTHTAESLGISLKTLFNKIKEYEIPSDYGKKH